MSGVHAVVGVLVMVSSGAAGLWGAWCWWRADTQPTFWTLLRASQVVLVAQVALGAIVLASGREPESLHILYGLLPLGTSFVAEQLRVVAADQVLLKRGLDGTSAMRALPDAEQRTIVVEIVQRETGVMAASAIVVFLLALRASGVVGFV